ncbi:UNVERIFIED_CONTAM: hypothetical protein FKN15_000691 [Acipenser sinensis]
MLFLLYSKDKPNVTENAVFLYLKVRGCDEERMNPNQQYPSRPMRALYNRNCGLCTEWLGS